MAGSREHKSVASANLFLGIVLFSMTIVACAKPQPSFQLRDDVAAAAPGSDLEPQELPKPLPQPLTKATPRESVPSSPPEALSPQASPADTPPSDVTPDKNEDAIAKTRTRTTPSQLFAENGRPLREFHKRLLERFGDRLNRRSMPADLSSSDLNKYRSIFRELQIAVTRQNGTGEKRWMFMDKVEALNKSKLFEEKGEVSKEGAWSIAVDSTAKRHGFANAPCAEFMSEIIRQAYARAGYPLQEDFNKEKGNPLIWSETASVTGLSKALFKAGWIPYAARDFRPPIGAILFHTIGISPSHTYAAAGDDGLLIVDNGSPQGRDLRKSHMKTVNLMFNTGFFMLPPGIPPQAW